MYGTSRRVETDDRMLAVNLLRKGLPAQFVTRVTGVQTSSLMALARLSPRRRTGYEPSVVAQRRVPHEPLRFVPPVVPGRSPADEVLAQVADKHGLTVSDLRSKRVTRAYAWPRQEAMYRLHKELGLSSTVTGRILGGRDHTTVMYGAAKHASRMGEGAE